MYNQENGGLKQSFLSWFRFIQFAELQQKRKREIDSQKKNGTCSANFGSYNTCCLPCYGFSIVGERQSHLQGRSRMNKSRHNKGWIVLQMLTGNEWNRQTRKIFVFFCFCSFVFVFFKRRECGYHSIIIKEQYTQGKVKRHTGTSL